VAAPPPRHGAGGHSQSRVEHERRPHQQQAARKALCDHLADGHLVADRRPEIPLEEARQVVHVLGPQRLVEPVVGAQGLPLGAVLDVARRASVYSAEIGSPGMMRGRKKFSVTSAKTVTR
jgi:hypothetical protein